MHLNMAGSSRITSYNVCYTKLLRKGTKLFAKILIEDKQIIEDLFTDVSSEDIGITKETLQTLLNKLQGGKHHD